MLDHVKKLFLGILCAACAGIVSGSDNEWSSVVPSEQRGALADRLNAYVKANRSRGWKKLYDLVSDAGRDDVSRENFCGEDGSGTSKGFCQRSRFASIPTGPRRKWSGYDIYGCGKTQREGQEFNGIALVHAVFEHNNRFFTGWSFTTFPNEPCKALSEPSWEMPGPLEWDRPMEELRGPAGVPFHLDPPKK